MLLAAGPRTGAFQIRFSRRMPAAQPGARRPVVDQAGAVLPQAAVGARAARLRTAQPGGRLQRAIGVMPRDLAQRLAARRCRLGTERDQAARIRDAAARPSTSSTSRPSRRCRPAYMTAIAVGEAARPRAEVVGDPDQRRAGLARASFCTSDEDLRPGW